MFVHEDERRKLIEWANGDFKVAKAVIAKGRSDCMCCVVGDHHHLKKDESFLLLSGFARLVIVGPKEWREVGAPFKWDVPRGAYHRFELVEGSVLLGVGTEEFDPEDEIPGRP